MLDLHNTAFSIFSGQKRKATKTCVLFLLLLTTQKTLIIIRPLAPEMDYELVQRRGREGVCQRDLNLAFANKKRLVYDAEPCRLRNGRNDSSLKTWQRTDKCGKGFK